VAFALFGLSIFTALTIASTSKAAIDSPAPPQVWSDKADYAPGEQVTLSGANWAVGEAVHIRVNDDAGQTWSRDVDVTAADDGTFTDQFNLPNWFVADYSVTATGAASGTATGNFTDAQITISPTTSTATVGNSRTYSATGQNCNLSGYSWTAAGQGTTPGTVTPSSGSASAFTVTFTGQGTVRIALDATGTNPSNNNACSGNDHVDVVVSGPTNHAPTASAGGPYSGNEGSPINLNGSGSSDPDAGDTLTYAWSYTKNTGRPAASCSFSSATAQSPTFTCTDNGAYTVSLTVTDNHGASSAASTAGVTVNNLAPTATFTAPSSVNEGSDISLSLTSPSDPSSVDTAAGFTYAFDCGSGYGAFSSTSTATCSTTDDGTRTVKGKIKDQDGSETEYTALVTVNNLDPTVTLAAGNTYAWDESTTAERSFSFSASDPGSDTLTISADCGPGTLVAGSLGASSFKCKFPDGPVSAGSEVSVSADDGDGGSDSDSHAVTVNNVAPQVAFTNAPASASEGDTKTYQFTVNDPGDDTYSAPSGYLTCGSGASLVSGSFSVGGNSGSKNGSFQCDFPDGPSSPTVSIRFTDSDGDSGTASQPVSVVNVAPQIQGFAATGVSVTACISGNTVTVSFTVFDPADQAHDPIVGTINWGDGSTTIAGRSISESHSYGAGSYTIQVSVNDGDGGSDTRTQAVGLLYNMSAIQPPINADGSSIFKYGSTIPVKVRITDCNGAPVPGLAPTIGLSLANSATPPPPINEEVYSTSSADTGNTMRYDASAGQYIYNFNTKSAAITDQNATYWMTVRSAVTSPSQVASKFGVKNK
jgi:hypothetical protein